MSGLRKFFSQCDKIYTSHFLCKFCYLNIVKYKLCYIQTLLHINFVTYKHLKYKLCYLKNSHRNLPGLCNTLSNCYVCSVQCTVYAYISASCTNLPQIFRLLFFLLIYIHLYNLCPGLIFQRDFQTKYYPSPQSALHLHSLAQT